MLQPEPTNKDASLRLIIGLANSVRLRTVNQRSKPKDPHVELEAFEQDVLGQSLASSNPDVRSRAINLIPQMKSVSALRDEYAQALLSTESGREKVILIDYMLRHVPARQSFQLMKCFALDSLQPAPVRAAAINNVQKLRFAVAEKVELFEGLLRDPTAQCYIPGFIRAIEHVDGASISDPAITNLFTQEDITVVLAAMRLRGKFLLGEDLAKQNPISIAAKEITANENVAKASVNAHVLTLLSYKLQTALSSRDPRSFMAALEIICADATLAQRLKTHIESQSVRPTMLAKTAHVSIDGGCNTKELTFRSDAIFEHVSSRRRPQVIDDIEVRRDVLRIHALGLAAVSSGEKFTISHIKEIPNRSEKSAYVSQTDFALAFWSEVTCVADDPDAYHAKIANKYRGATLDPLFLSTKFSKQLAIMDIVGPFRVDIYEALSKCFTDPRPLVRIIPAMTAIALGSRLERGEVLSGLFPPGTNGVERSIKALLMATFQPNSAETTECVQRSLLSSSDGEVIAGIWCAELMKESASAVSAELTVAGMSNNKEVATRARNVLSRRSIRTDVPIEGGDDSFFGFKRTA